MTAPQSPFRFSDRVGTVQGDNGMTEIPMPTPAYCFKLLKEAAWTVFLFVALTVATSLYGLSDGDMLTWDTDQWLTWTLGFVPVTGRFIAAMVITAVTGNSVEDGFTVN